MLEIGSVIDGKYKILSEIGRGGMSVVYMALNEKANKTWAIKEVRKGGQVDFESVRQGLIVETEMLKNLKHPNLPSIVDVIDRGDIFLIVMDYIEGVSLAKALSLYGVQSQEVVVDWARQLCDVLGYLHNRQKPIIYRDLKPQNVMLKPDGTLTLIDFGTAREFKETNIQDTTCLGTIGYAAPEQYGGQGQTDARTDIFCLGATLYHLITGLNPAEPPYEIRPIRQANPQLSGGLERILIKCTQKDPSLRYQSCAELMYDLEHYEEIDEVYINGLKSKIIAFFLVAGIALTSLAAGIAFLVTANNLATDTYAELISSAQLSSDYQDKLDLLQEAMLIDGKTGDAEAYIELIQVFKDGDDSLFDAEEEALLVKLIKTNAASMISANKEEYAELCFEVGRLYWYYYDSGSSTDSAATRMKSSIAWFQTYMSYAPENHEDQGMANAYANIGLFYRDITTSVVEGSDAGLYLPLYENFEVLLAEIATDETESDIVRLEILSLARSAIEQYTSKFKNDGITQEGLLTMLDTIETIANGINANVDATLAKKTEILENLESTRTKVNNAYGG